MENENNNIPEENKIPEESEIKVTNEITPEPNEVRPEAVEELMNKYEKDVSDGQYETKKVLMITAICAIIIAVIIALIMAFQKSPEETLKSALDKTFADEALNKRADFIKDAILDGKAELNANLQLTGISGNEYLSAIVANDLNITKPSINLNLKTDIQNKNLLFNFASTVENTVYDDAEENSYESADTRAAFSYFVSNDLCGASDDSLSVKTSVSNAPDMMNFISEEKITDMCNEFENVVNPGMVRDIMNAFVDNLKVFKANEAYGYKINGTTVGTNKYTLIVTPENKNALMAEIDLLYEKYDNANLIDLREFINSYISENTEISIYERGGFIKGISLASEASENNASNTDNYEAGNVYDYSFEILFTDTENCLSSIDITSAVSNEYSKISVNLTDEITDSQHSLTGTVSFDSDELSFDLSGDAYASKTEDDFMKDISDNLSSYADFYDDTTAASFIEQVCFGSLFKTLQISAPTYSSLLFMGLMQ